MAGRCVMKRSRLVEVFVIVSITWHKWNNCITHAEKTAIMPGMCVMTRSRLVKMFVLVSIAPASSPVCSLLEESCLMRLRKVVNGEGQTKDINREIEKRILQNAKKVA